MEDTYSTASTAEVQDDIDGEPVVTQGDYLYIKRFFKTGISTDFLLFVCLYRDGSVDCRLGGGGGEE